jgi:caffeoyl-CoA O-methyltransferase
MLFDEKLINYLSENLDQESDILKKIYQDTIKNIPKSNMISGHLQGRFLSMISKMINPKNILEIGTFTGYSAICLAEGLCKDGELHTVEKDPFLFQTSKNNLKDFKNIKIHLGDGLEIIDNFDIFFDLIFVDCNKKNYIKYYNKLINKLNKNRYMIFDNVLWKGEVFDSSKKNSIGKSIEDFNFFVKNDERVEKVIVPIRDGLFLIRKK